jgi:hypothetical protein
MEEHAQKLLCAQGQQGARRLRERHTRLTCLVRLTMESSGNLVVYLAARQASGEPTYPRMMDFPSGAAHSQRLP